MPTLRVIGPGRAGSSISTALSRAGWRALAPVPRGAPVAEAAAGVDLLVVATPDAVIAEVARAVTPVATTVVAHLSGALGLDALDGHPRRAAIHPLVALPGPEIGAERLPGAWFAVSGDPMAGRVVEALGGRAIAVTDCDRAAYHAAACVASNHLVALLATVERLAAEAGVPLAAYLDLARQTIDNVERLGAAAALTGPVARGDWDTVARHLAVVSSGDRAAYEALADVAAGLAGRQRPAASPTALVGA